MRTFSVTKSFLTVFAAAVLGVSGCVPVAPGATGPGPDPVSSHTQGSDAPETPAQDQPPAPRVQEETCDWDSPQLVSQGASGIVPSGQVGSLPDTIIGAWQHTHFDTGSGFEPVAEDIRYVFPSIDRILYCQHVPGITNQAQNAADISWEGDRIVLPGAAPGYLVTEWSDSAMVWLNLMDDSHYLLQRR